MLFICFFIVDFGLSREMLDGGYYKTESKTFPVKWCGPEVFEYGTFTSAGDVWSFGNYNYNVNLSYIDQPSSRYLCIYDPYIYIYTYITLQVWSCGNYILVEESLI